MNELTQLAEAGRAALAAERLALVDGGAILSIPLCRQLTTALERTGLWWTCTQCEYDCIHDYDALAEVGSPICPACDIELERRI